MTPRALPLWAGAAFAEITEEAGARFSQYIVEADQRIVIREDR